jgi:hypothetical protein
MARHSALGVLGVLQRLQDRQADAAGNPLALGEEGVVGWMAPDAVELAGHMARRCEARTHLAARAICRCGAQEPSASH